MTPQPHPRVLWGSRALTAAACVFVVLVGGLVLVGWMFDLTVLKSVVPAGVTMKANTAVAFLLAGAALGLLRAEPVGPRFRRLAQGCAAAVALVGLVTLAEYAFGRDLGIDQLLFREPPGATGTSSPGRMAPTAALNFGLVGLALLLLDVQTRRGHRPAEVLALTAAWVALLALVGYAYGVTFLHTLAASTQMALPTALTFIVLGVGLLLARPDRGLMATVTSASSGGVLARRLLPAVLGIPLLLGWLRLEGELADFYDTELGVSLRVVSSILLLTAIVWLTARSLNRTDAAHQRAEGEIRKMSAFLDSVVENIPIMLFVKDAVHLRFERCNRACEQLLGYPREAFLGKSDYDFFPKEEADFFIAKDREVLQSHMQVDIPEEVIKTRYGERILHTKKIPILDESGRPRHLVGISEDITERKRAEEDLRRTTAELRFLNDLVEQTTQPLGVADFQGRLVRFNRAFERLTGYGADELRTMTYLQLTPAGWHEMEDRQVAHVLATGEAVRYEKEYRRKDGTLVPVELIVDLYRNAAGEPQYVYAFVTDITERKRVEAALQTAKEAAEAANRAKSEFLANMSHEIRTPMNGILGMTELALDTELTPEQRDYLNLVKASADSLLTVINDILDFSKIEARKLQLEAVTFHLRDHLGDTMKALALRAQQKGLELACHIPPGVPDMVVGDPGRLRQVVVNLVGNALKFTEHGEVVVRVTTESAEAEVVGLHFAVTDTGIGIPADMQGRIFEAFAQVDGSATRKYGGTGLGLTISAQLVQLMGGRIWVESELGKGSTFHFTARFSLPQGAALRPPPARPASLHDLPVLVVDDNATNRRILEEMLGHWHMRPVAVEDGRAALAALRRAVDTGEPFPLVLLDGHMPEMDGFALAEQIRRSPDLTGTTIVMLTSAGQPGDVARCRELGITAYLMKPVKQSELLDTILTALGSSWEPPEPALAAGPAPSGRPLHVLLAEDNAVNQKLVVRLLEKQGHTVVVAGNGREALAALERGRFDLVLMDVQMPELDGLAATARIRASEASGGSYTPAGTRLPILAMTAHALKGDRERCLAAGMDGYVCKPIQSQQLFEAIADVVSGGAAAGPAAPPVSPAAEVLDKAEALGRVGDDVELLKELVGLFLESCPRQLAELRQAVARRDAPALRRTAHALKGAVGIFGARAAVAAAQRLETMGRAEDLTHADAACAALEEALARLEPALADLVAGARAQSGGAPFLPLA
jgi:PAS domain S-box-containing protein